MSDSGCDFDVVVIGAGIGGLSLGAVLSKIHHKKVLVLEKAPYIGGRLVSYKGKGEKVYIDGLELDYIGFQDSLTENNSWIAACEPDIDTIFKNRLLDGWAFEIGGHGLFWGEKSRMHLLLDRLGEPVDIPLGKGLAWVECDRPDGVYPVRPGESYPWQSKQGYKATVSALKKMSCLSMRECADIMNIDLGQWMADHGVLGDREAYRFIKLLMGCQCAIAEPELAPAGDVLGYMTQARGVGANLNSGSVSTVGDPGCIALAMAMERVIVKNGGEIKRSSRVEKTIIQNGQAVGVVVSNGNGGREVVTSHITACNIPPRRIFSVIDPVLFPASVVKTIFEGYWSAALLNGLVGIKENLWERFGVDERSFILMPMLIEELDPDNPFDVVIWNSASCAKRAPGNKKDFLFSIGLREQDVVDSKKTSRIIESCMDWFRKTFPDWKEMVEFTLWTACNDGYGDWRPVGEKRLENVCPHIKNLYFVGDQYGERNWGGGVDSAVLSAVMCADSMLGSNLEEEIFPPHHRGLPRN